MTESTVDTVGQRLRRLERAVRWWRFGTIGILLFAIMTIFAPNGDEICPTAELREGLRWPCAGF